MSTEIKELWHSSPFFRYMATVFLIGVIFLYRQASSSAPKGPPAAAPASSAVQNGSQPVAGTQYDPFGNLISSGVNAATGVVNSVK